MKVLLLLACLGAVSAKSTRIVGGHNTNTHHHKHQMSLTFSNGAHTCGGSMITPYHVLTAAHCVQSSASNYRIVANDGNREDPDRIIHMVAEVINHPDYGVGQGAYPNDIAVLRIVTDMTAGTHHEPIELSTSSDNFDGHTCHITGWGRTQTGGQGDLPLQLQEANGRILNHNECRNWWSSNYNSAAHVCVHQSNSGGCNGDSGGPLVCSHKLVGAASWVYTGCVTEYPTVYARVATYHSWILSNLN